MGKTSSDKQLAIRGVLLNGAGLACNIVIAFYMAPFLIHALGDERYGLWTIIMSLGSYYALGNLGIRTAGTKYIAQYHAMGDRDAISKVIATSLVVFFGLSVLVLIATGFVVWLLPPLLNLEEVSTSTVRITLALSGLMMAIRMYAQVFTGTVIALKRFDIQNGFAIAIQLLTAAGIATSVHRGGGLVEMAIVIVSVATLGHFARAFVARKLLSDVPVSIRNFDRTTLRTVFRFGALSTVAKASRKTAERLGPLLIGIMIGPATVPFYAIAETLTHKSKRLGGAINTVILPLISGLDAKGEQKAITTVTYFGARLLLALGLFVSICLVVVGRDLIRFWIGPEYVEQSYPVLCLLSVTIVANFSSGPLRGLMRGTENVATLFRIALIELTVIGVGMPLGTWLWGIRGTATALLVGQGMSGFLIMPLVTCRKFGWRLSHYLQHVWLAPLLVGGVTVVAVLLTSQFMVPTRTLHVLGQCLIVAVFAGASVWLFCFDQARRNDVLEALPIHRLFRRGAAQK